MSLSADFYDYRLIIAGYIDIALLIIKGVKINCLRRSIKKSIALLTAVAMFFAPLSNLAAATVDPSSSTLGSDSAVCAGGSEEISVSITLPPAAVSDKVDVFFFFDDTGSFASFVPTVTSIFGDIVGELETTLPGVEFGFGVGRFEDYGGPGSSFSGDSLDARPFILNQPIVTAATAGSTASRDSLIGNALSRTAPGSGGDGPETPIAEGLFQIATGAGFDGDGNGSDLDSGNAGDMTTQTSPGDSGDVPPFSSNVAPSSGNLGGAGWRPDALHLAIVATDTCPVAAFPAGASIPAAITGAGGASEPTSVFACSSTPGSSRFGFISDAKDSAGNTVDGAVVPSGAGSVQATVNAINGLGIRVLGMGPSAAPTTSTGPSFDPSVFLSGLARLTGALDSSGDPLVFSTSVSSADLTASIANAISTTATEPVDIEVSTSALPSGLSVTAAPAVVTSVGPGETANFVLTLTGSGSALNGGFDVQFKDRNSGAELGTIPVTIDCGSISEDTTPPRCTVGPVTSGTATVTAQDMDSGLSSVTTIMEANATVEVPTFTAGTTVPVAIVVSQTDPAFSSSARLTVSDQAGNVAMCPPVSIKSSSGKPTKKHKPTKHHKPSKHHKPTKHHKLSKHYKPTKHHKTSKHYKPTKHHKTRKPYKPTKHHKLRKH